MSEIPVSVIIPVYNVEAYLREALDSVIGQTYENLEIIVIDDGSTDNSGNICDEYAVKDSRIRVIHQKNNGLSAARNAGLDVMNGDLVVFLDPDDAYLPEYVNTLMDTLIREDADIVVCRYISYKESGKLNMDHKRTLWPAIGHGSISRIEALRALVRNEINFGVWNKIYRRELWNDLRFPEGHVHEDNATTFLVIDLSNKITVIDDVLYLHRQRPGSITHLHTVTNLSDKMLACSCLDNYIEKNTPAVFSADDLNQGLQATLNSIISVYAQYKNKNDAVAVELRDRSIKKGRQLGLDTMSCRTRIAFFMLCHCPNLLTIAYPIYLSIRRLTYKLPGDIDGPQAKHS